MSHPHEEGPTFTKLEAKLGAVPVDYVGPARRQVGQVRHGAKVGDAGTQDVSGRLTDRPRRLVVVLAYGSQPPCPKSELHEGTMQPAEGEDFRWPVPTLPPRTCRPVRCLPPHGRDLAIAYS